MPTAAEYQDRALREVGQLQINALFEVNVPRAVSGGTFVASFNGSDTDALDYNIAADDFQEALEGLDTIGTDGVRVTGPRKGPYLIGFVGPNAGQEMPFPSFDGTDLTPSGVPTATLIRQGLCRDFRSDASLLWDEYSGSVNDQVRYLRMKIGLIDLQLGIYSTLVDNSTGNINRVDSKESQRFNNLVRMRAIAEGDLEKEKADAVAASSGQTYFGEISKKTPNGLAFGCLRRDGYGRLRR